jgi:hypothetical protein
MSPKNTILNGVEGKVKILSITYTRRWLNKYPEYELKLLVSLSGKEPYKTTMLKIGTPLMVIKLKEGAEFSVIADKDDPNNLEIKELEEYYTL